MSGLLWTLPHDDFCYGRGGHQIVEWNFAGENLYQRVRFLGNVKQTGEFTPQSQPSQTRIRPIPCCGVYRPSIFQVR